MRLISNQWVMGQKSNVIDAAGRHPHIGAVFTSVARELTHRIQFWIQVKKNELSRCKRHCLLPSPQDGKMLVLVPRVFQIPQTHRANLLALQSPYGAM